MTYEISNRASDTIENQRLIIAMQKLADQLNVDASNETYGISGHERTHLIGELKRYLGRVDNVLLEEVSESRG